MKLYTETRFISIVHTIIWISNNPAHRFTESGVESSANIKSFTQNTALYFCVEYGVIEMGSKKEFALKPRKTLLI